jgi:hypothetical protein
MAGVVVSMRTAATSHMTQHNLLVVLKMYFQKLTEPKIPRWKTAYTINYKKKNVYTYSILHSLFLHKGHINYLGNTSTTV